MQKYKRGLTAGVYDMFHIGHLNILKNAKAQCNFLIVAVSTDEVVLSSKNKTPVIPFDERVEIIKAIKYVDAVIPQISYSIEGKVKIALDNKIDVMFVGSDWHGTEKWNNIENKLNEIGCDVVYLPHTDGISSTVLREKIENL